MNPQQNIDLWSKDELNYCNWHSKGLNCNIQEK
jgi:hypothetical protein